jgi:hypothetical protein
VNVLDLVIGFQVTVIGWQAVAAMDMVSSP